MVFYSPTKDTHCARDDAMKLINKCEKLPINILSSSTES
jgi:hypothetical protein